MLSELRINNPIIYNLNTRISKDDGTNEKQAQTVDEEYCREFDKLCSLTIDVDPHETATSIDNSWNSLRKLVSEENNYIIETFRIIREEACIPLYTMTSACEHQLKILFLEANLLENKAAQGKNLVERTKSRANVMQLKYEQLKETLKQNVLTASEINRIIVAKSESEDASLDLDEAETNFQTIISEYELRMPEII